MKQLRLLLLLLAVCAVGITLYWFVPFITPPRPLPVYQLPRQHDGADTLSVAFIGDSWAFEHQPYDAHLARLLQATLKRPVSVWSGGICGHTGKEVYRALFMDTALRRLMTARPYDLCIVSAGINDTYKKLPPQCYSQSMDLIIRFLLANGVRPVIIEIPDYDIHRAYELQRPSRKVLRRLTMAAAGTPMDSRRQMRDALRQTVAAGGYADSISIVDYRTWNAHFADDQRRYYRADGMHLNADGQLRLDSAIARTIGQTIANKGKK